LNPGTNFTSGGYAKRKKKKQKSRFIPNARPKGSGREGKAQSSEDVVKKKGASVKKGKRHPCDGEFFGGWAFLSKPPRGGKTLKKEKVTQKAEGT